MTLLSGGTSTTTTLRGFVQNTNLSATDAATVSANIKYDGALVNGAWTQIRNHAVYPGGFTFGVGGQALLYVPRRGVLQVLEGDVVCYDPNGWPILVSGWSINGAGVSGWSNL